MATARGLAVPQGLMDALEEAWMLDHGSTRASLLVMLAMLCVVGCVRRGVGGKSMSYHGFIFGHFLSLPFQRQRCRPRACWASVSLVDMTPKLRIGCHNAGSEHGQIDFVPDLPTSQV